MEAIAAEPLDKPELPTGKPHDNSLHETPSTITVPRGTTWRNLSLIAASVVVLALLGAIYVLVKRNREARARSEAMAASLSGTQSELAREREAVELFASPTSRIVALKGTPAAPLASAKFAIDPETGRGLLLASNLPRVAEDRTYQLWYLVDGKPVPGGLFNTDSAGRGKLNENVTPAGRAASGFAVTAEPRGGTPAPTGQILLAGG
jgi:anti-sigma-K factor RskA